MVTMAMVMAFKMLSLFLLCGFLFSNSFVIQEANIKDIQCAFSQNKLTSRQLVDFYLHQIEALNPELRSVIEVNPDAREQADMADAEIKSKKELGELHGIPVLLKDSINTKGKLNTTAGSYALLGAEVAGDAAVVERLRKAGAVILGKASMSEWYHFRSQKPRKDRPTCSHCGIQGHTVDKCYKIHGYPPGYKPKSRNQQPRAHANQVASHINDTSSSQDSLSSLSPAQCQQLIALLSSQLHGPSPASLESQQAGPSVANFSGILDLSLLFSLFFTLFSRCPRSGQGVNPYLASGDPCGSSSGCAISVAANMVAVSLGSETDGSIICPADVNSVVGFKPTVGLTSRAGVIPISPRQDSVGPICRSVLDAVYVLDAIVGFDPRDSEATKEASKFIPVGGYKQLINKYGLTGKRLGVVRNPFSGFYNGSTAISAFEAHLTTLRQRGAILVDNLEIENVAIIFNPYESGESTALLAEFKLNINEYLKELTSSPVRSLSDIIAFNLNNSHLEKTDECSQEVFIAAEMTNGIGEQERMAMERMLNLSREGFEKLMMENELDATVTLGPGMATVLAIGGYPGVSVPAGYDGDGMPFGICFGGLKGMEPKLIEVAYGFEQATKIRRPPAKLPLSLM